MDTRAALRPLDEVAEFVRRLDEYRTTAELSDAVEAIAAAVERSLRALLRGDRDAPDEHRLAAIAPASLPYDDVIHSLRSRDRVSIELAGAVHELRAAADRARSAESRPSDADVAARAVERLRAEIRALAPESPAGAPGVADPRSATPDPAPVAVRRSGEGRRRLAWVGAAVALLFLVALAWVLARGGGGDYDDAVTAFRAGRLDAAAAGFERVLDARPGDVSVMLYLGRIYRRQTRWDDAAGALRAAAGEAPEDPDVRRELGHLFMDLGQPQAAIRQYERALEHDPEEKLNWAGLIRALRATGDPRADRLLRDAPPDVQAALGGSRGG